MLYLYDEAICKDLRDSFDSDNVNSVVKVATAESAIELLAQANEDHIQLPLVVVDRKDYEIDTSLTNFTRMKKGVPTVLDKESNILYYERAIPVMMSYEITILATCVEDRDELIRELLFKYSSMYFLTIQAPYESNRYLRFGLVHDNTQPIQYSSGTLEYLHSGALYQAILTFSTQGCVMLSYRPKKLQHLEHGNIEILDRPTR